MIKFLHGGALLVKVKVNLPVLHNGMGQQKRARHINTGLAEFSTVLAAQAYWVNIPELEGLGFTVSKNELLSDFLLLRLQTVDG